MLGAHTVSYHDGHGSRKSQSAGAADYQNRNTSGQGKTDVFSCQQPDRNCDEGDRDNRRHEDTGYPVCHLGNGRFGCRCIAHHFDDLGKCRVLAYPSGLTDQITGLVQGRCGDGVPGRLIGRDALTGQCCLVDRAVSFPYNTIHGYIFTGAHHEEIADPHLLNGNFFLLAVFS